MRDLLVITPTRGRPQRALRLASSIQRTSTLKTDLCFAFDTDDETADETMAACEPYGVQAMIGERQGLGPWTNQVAQAHFGDYRAFASLGDDHVPRTLGWDAECWRVLEAMEGGFVAPNGGLSPGLAEAVVVSAPIVEALGWICVPGLKHWWIDRAWLDLGSHMRRYQWLADIDVPHWQDPSDATGQEAWSSIDTDRVTYAAWLLERFGADLETARKAVGA